MVSFQAMGDLAGSPNGYFILQGVYIEGVIKFAGTVSGVPNKKPLEYSCMSHEDHKNGARLADWSPSC
jgi:hypothetical protein